MLTRCPSCQTVFRVDADTLNIAQGQVRCGRCAVQFNALDNLLEPDAASDGVNAGVTATERDGAASVTAEDDQAIQEAESTVSTHAQQAPMSPQAEALDAAASITASTPVEAPVLSLEAIQQALLIEDLAQPRVGIRRVGGFLILVLLALLVGQWVYMQRVPLYDKPALRPVLERYCALLGCDLPLLRMPERIEVLERSVREHPREAGALLATMRFVSRADRPIAYPLVVMQLGDVSGNRVVGRRFTPAEYLPPGVDIRAGMLPDQPVQIALELAEPKMKVVSFYFEFY